MNGGFDFSEGRKATFSTNVTVKCTGLFLSIPKKKKKKFPLRTVTTTFRGTRTKRHNIVQCVVRINVIYQKNCFSVTFFHDLRFVAFLSRPCTITLDENKRPFRRVRLVRISPLHPYIKGGRVRRDIPPVRKEDFTEFVCCCVVERRDAFNGVLDNSFMTRFVIKRVKTAGGLVKMPNDRLFGCPMCYFSVF